MANTESQKTRPAHLLDMPVLRAINLNLETSLYILLGLAAIVACFYNLGARAQSHDESLHALYSWKLYAGQGYQHNPMMHGPFLFHINALFYFLFGTSDFTARISAALFGVILVLLPALLRKELGRVGALITSVLTLISPSTLYYARYIRNDIYMMVWALLMAAALFRYLDTRKPGWIYLGVLAVMLSMTTKETAYITGFIGFTFAVMLWIQQMLTAKATRRAMFVGVVLALVLVVALVGLNLTKDSLPLESSDPEVTDEGFTQQNAQKLIEILFLLIGILVTMLLGSVLIRRDERQRPGLTQIGAYVAAIGGLIAICTALAGLLWLAVIQIPEDTINTDLFIGLQVFAAGLGIVAGAYAWWRVLQAVREQEWMPKLDDKVLLIAIALAVVPFVLLYTTFFTNPKGLGSGTFGGIAYWLGQQEVKRAGQPWYYYLIIAPIYEFLPIGFGLIAMFYYLITGRVDRPKELAEQEEGTARPSLPFVAYAVYWTLSAWLIYSWAGEKMPWMMVHVVQPMIVLTGRFADDLLYGVDWRAVWRKGGAVLALLVPIILLAAGMVIGLPIFGQAFKGKSLTDLGDTSRWLSAAVTGGGLAYLAYRIWRGLGKQAAWRVVFVALLALTAAFTVRFAWMAAYVNYDTAKEFLVYAHGTSDVKQTVEELQEISRRLYGDESSIKFAYSSDATWPFEWYFETLFPNRVFFGTEPTREATNVPVLVVGRAEIDKTEPFLGDRYYRFDRKLVWWPHQSYYMGLSLAMPPEEERQVGKNYFLLDMMDAEKRRAFWNVLFYRRYDQSLADWEPSHPFAFYVRKDVAAQLWDYGLAPEGVELMPEEQDSYAKNQRPLTSVQVWNGDTGAGRFNSPHNLALGPDGSLYVLDSGNHRVQVYGPDGAFVTAWGHLCKLDAPSGCQSPNGEGGFHDPWGIAVDQNGYVYVADTWNHRIQKFDSTGTFVTMWGMHGVTEDATGAESLFWGPRDVAVGPGGRIYVSDTGNKRVQAFEPDGTFVTQWGDKGLQDGRMDEPAGLAIADDGTVYVADTWNQRIQVFDMLGLYLRRWDVASWYGQSLVNKPYLAVDAQGRVYASDPEGYRILVFDPEGRYIASLGQYGAEDNAFMLPTGIAVDPLGYIYVADPATNRVIKFAPLE